MLKIKIINKNESLKLMLILILLIFLLLTAVASAEKKILVLHSYHQGLEWTDQISAGIRSVFPYQDQVKIYYEYLDTKRNYSEKYYDKLIALYREKAKLIDFDVIIVSDNAAFDFMLEYGTELYGETPLVFCGVNNLNKDLLKKRKDICGIIEKAEHRETIALIMKLHPDLNNLIIINDQTLTGRNIKEELQLILKDYKNKLDYQIWDELSLAELQQRLNRLNEKDVIYLLVFNRDKNGKFISYNQFMNKIENINNNPIYGTWDFYLGKGIVGGKLISAKNQGRQAALMAKKSINGEDICSRKVIKDNQNKYLFDYLKLKKYNISKYELPQGSKVVNKPENFLQRNDEFLIWGLIFLSIVIIMLLIFFYFKHNEKKKLDKLNKELEKKVEIRTKELKKIIITDELTDIFNRRYILKILEREIEKAKRYHRNLAVIMIDIDFFKKVNDNYGHQFGDQILKIMGSILKNKTRNIDFAGRYGGEEFLIILPETNLREGYLAAEKLRKAVKNTQIKNFNSKITVSCGVAELRAESSSSEQLIKRADDLLYKAKANGRDRVEI